MNKLLVFTAEWCKPCKRLKTNLSRITPELENYVKLYDIDVQAEAAIKYDIGAVPTLITLDEAGKEVSRKLGIQSTEQLEQLIRNV
jgi:thioredoxin 1